MPVFKISEDVVEKHIVTESGETTTAILEVDKHIKRIFNIPPPEHIKKTEPKKPKAKAPKLKAPKSTAKSKDKVKDVKKASQMLAELIELNKKSKTTKVSPKKKAEYHADTMKTMDLDAAAKAWDFSHLKANMKANIDHVHDYVPVHDPANCIYCKKFEELNHKK